MGTDDIQDLVGVTEIAVPPGSDYRNRSPKTDPFLVVPTTTWPSQRHWSPTTTPTQHSGSDEIRCVRDLSGDTTKSDNLVTLAKDTDILVHEAQFSLDDAHYHNRFHPNYLVHSHTAAEQVGEVAAAANAKHVILSHYSPTDLPDSEWLDAIESTSPARSPSRATVRSSPCDQLQAPKRSGIRPPKSRIAFSELTFRRVVSSDDHLQQRKLVE